MSKAIRLRGKYAVGDYSHAIVDDEDYERLSQYVWKAKPSSTNVYAVRNLKRADGSWTTLRMHRVVMGYEGGNDIDHINRNTMDNTRANLRIVTRAQNIANRGQIKAGRMALADGLHTSMAAWVASAAQEIEVA